MGDTLLQRREQREIEEGRAVIQALEQKLQEVRAVGAAGKQDRYVHPSNELQQAEQQLKDEQKKVSSD